MKNIYATLTKWASSHLKMGIVDEEAIMDIVLKGFRIKRCL